MDDRPRIITELVDTMLIRLTLSKKIIKWSCVKMYDKMIKCRNE